MIRIILFCAILLIYTAAQKDVSAPRTVDQCYGQPIPVACDPGYMVKVNNAFYRQTEKCRGGYRSNYCSKEEPSNPACVGNQTCVFTTPWIYLSSECGYSNNFLVSYQCVPSSIQSNICEEKVIHSSSGYIVSPNYPNKYPKSLQCHTKVKVRAGQRIRVYLLDLYLAYYNYDVDKQCVDALWIVDGKERTDYMCSGKQRGLVFTSQSNEITVFFTTEGHEYLNAKGFWIFFEGVASSRIEPRRATYVKKPSSRSQATKAEEKLLSLLPIQVTPTDSSIIPPVQDASREVEEITGAPEVAIPKVTAPFKFQGHSRHSSGQKYKSGGAGRPQGQRGHSELTRIDNQGSGLSNYKQGQKIQPWQNKNENVGQHVQSSSQQTQDATTIYSRKSPNQAEYPAGRSNEYTRIAEFPNRRYPGRLQKDKSEEIIISDKSKEVAATQRHIPTLVTALTTTQAQRRYFATRKPYIPTERSSQTSPTEKEILDSDIMQINMYNSLDEDDELFNLLSKSGELVKGLKISRAIPKVKSQVRQKDAELITDDKYVFKQAPLATLTPTASETVAAITLPMTTPSPGPIQQEETPVLTRQNIGEPPVGKVNQTLETILPWNSVYASQVKGIQEKEEASTGGIVGGAAGCILLVLAFVVLAIFWRRRHPHEKGGFPFSRKSSSYNDIIMAYAPSEAGSTAGASNFGFDECPLPAALTEFPLDSCVPNPNYVSPMQSWRNLLPIDEAPEIIYAEHKGDRPGLQSPSKPNRSMLWMRSKSLDDLCSKIGNKVTKRRKKPPDPPPIQQSQSLDCLKRAYENVILPASYHTMMTAVERPPPVMQRMASLTDLHPLDSHAHPLPPLSPSDYNLHLQAMQQHMQQQHLQQQQYLLQQHAVFQQQQQLQNPQTPIQHVQGLAPNVHPANPRPGYESLCLDGAAAAAKTAPAHSAALQSQDTTLLTRYETMALHKTPADDEVAL